MVWAEIDETPAKLFSSIAQQPLDILTHFLCHFESFLIAYYNYQTINGGYYQINATFGLCKIQKSESRWLLISLRFVLFSPVEALFTTVGHNVWELDHYFQGFKGKTFKFDVF